MNRHKGPPAGLTGTVDHIDAGDGWRLVRLLTKQALLREGLHMAHCVGDGDYEHLAGDEDLTSDSIWSLRDPDGVSRATLDVRAGTGGRRHVVMAKGPGNRGIRRSDVRRLQALVVSFRAADVPLDFMGETGLVMADDGRVMRHDQAPAAVRDEARVRHAASMHPSRERLPECETRLSLQTFDPDEATCAVDAFVAAESTRDTTPVPHTMLPQNLKKGDVYKLDGYEVTDVVVTTGREILSEGVDYTVDDALGTIEVHRDLPGETVITYRAPRGPRWGLMSFGADISKSDEDGRPHRRTTQTSFVTLHTRSLNEDLWSRRSDPLSDP